MRIIFKIYIPGAAVCLSLFGCSAFAAKDYIQGHIGGMSNQARNDVGYVPGNRYNGEIEFDYFNDVHQVDRRFTFASRVNDENLTMYSLQEAYAGRRGLFKPWNSANHSGDHLKFGRVIVPWSSVDSKWGLGKLNNRRNFDFLEPGQEGLIGLSYENKSTSGFIWKVFGSSIYVPETNPSMDIDKENGTIKSRHPWSKAPAASTDLEGVETPIRYNVDYPTIPEVIYRYTLGASIGFDKKHWAGDVFFMRKPENQISTKVRVSLISDPNDFHIKANVTPQFYYHDVFGSNLKWRNKDVEIYASGIGIFPNTFPDGDKDATLFTELKTEKRREAYAGGGISKSNDKYSMGLNYVARLSPFDRERDSLAEDPRWNQAINVFLSRNFGRYFNLSGDVKYDMLSTDRLVMLSAGYKASKDLLLNVGLNMIGTPNNGKSFWSPYTNNDAVYGSLKYLF